MKNIPVVIFGDEIAAYGVIRALSNFEIPLYIVSQTGKGLSVKSRYVQKTFVLKSSENNFTKRLTTLLYREVGSEMVLIVAGDDNYLDALARSYEQLPSGFRLTFPGWNIVKLVREKRYTYKIAEELGVPVPKTYYVGSEKELKGLLDVGIEAPFPLLMRSEKRSSEFLVKYKKKGVICDNPKQVIDNYHKYGGFCGDLLVQEMIPGDESLLYNFIGAFNGNSDPIAIFMNKKRRSYRQFLGCTLMESMWSDTVAEYSLKLVKKIGYFGYANPEFKLDLRDGQLKLMEINGRVTISNSHSLRCGINIPYVIYKEALEGPILSEKVFEKRYSDNILWWEPFSDFISSFRLFLDGRLTIQQYLKSISGTGYIIEPINWKDPLPAINFVNKLIFMTGKRIKEFLL